VLPGRGKEERVIKLVFTLRRRPDLLCEEFQRYWREMHAPLVASKAEILKICRYVQVHARENEVNPLLSGLRGSESNYCDGVVELRWDSLEEMKSVFTTEEQTAGDELLEDERNFIDLPNSPLWLGEENVVIG
jgi:hypothetical protein